MMLKKLPGVRVPHRKNTAGMAPVRMTIPQVVTLPMSMHIGAPAKCLVNVNDHVDVGQVIAQAGGFVSVPVHATVSGTVSKIATNYLMANGRTCTAVVIKSDGMMTRAESVQPPVINDYASFIEAVRASGVVGLGGAGFPTCVKLDIKDLSRLKDVIVNGAECEPYITSDTRTMIDDAEYIKKGCQLLEKYLDAKKITLAVEENKPEAIDAMQEIAKDDDCISVKVLPSVYPQGGEKVLIYNVTGRIVAEGKLPLDAGCIVINCTTLAFIAKYVETGMPLVEKCVTVDGSAVASPKNIIAPIGTPLSDIFAFAGGFKTEPYKVLMGGLMMGSCVYNMETPLVKNNNAILALNERDAQDPVTTACIRCGACASHCPLHLNPAAMARAYKVGDDEALNSLKVMLCMECGCCSFICPAKRPLVQTNKLAKDRVRAYQKALADKAAAEAAAKAENTTKEEAKKA